MLFFNSFPHSGLIVSLIFFSLIVLVNSYKISPDSCIHHIYWQSYELGGFWFCSQIEPPIIASLCHLIAPSVSIQFEIPLAHRQRKSRQSNLFSWIWNWARIDFCRAGESGPWIHRIYFNPDRGQSANQRWAYHVTGSKDQHLDPVMVQISHFWENSTLFGYFASPTLMLTICSLSAVTGTAQNVEICYLGRLTTEII